MNNLVFNPKHKIVKIIAAIVCVCFLWQDAVFASGGDFLRGNQYLEQAAAAGSAQAGGVGEAEPLEGDAKLTESQQKIWDEETDFLIGRYKLNPEEAKKLKNLHIPVLKPSTKEAAKFRKEFLETLGIALAASGFAGYSLSRREFLKVILASTAAFMLFLLSAGWWFLGKPRSSLPKGVKGTIDGSSALFNKGVLDKIGAGPGFRALAVHELIHRLGCADGALRKIKKDLLFAESYVIIRLLSIGGIDMLRQAYEQIEDDPQGCMDIVFAGALFYNAYPDPEIREKEIIKGIISEYGGFDPDPVTDNPHKNPSAYIYGLEMGGVAWMAANGGPDEALRYLDLRSNGYNPQNAEQEIKQGLAIKGNRRNTFSAQELLKEALKRRHSLAGATGEGIRQTFILVAYISSIILLGGFTLYLFKKAARSILYSFPKNRQEIYGMPVGSLLEKIPEELDAWLDKPVKVALWVADHDETLSMSGSGKIRRDILNLITGSLIKTKALWMIFTGSAVYENPQTDIGRRTLQPIEGALLKRRRLEPLSRLMVLGAIGQQIISHNKKGQRTHIENRHARHFTPAQQLYIMKLWLNHFITLYYTVHVKKDKIPQISREEFKTKIEKANSPEEMESLAAEIMQVLNLSRFEIVRRGVNPETLKFSHNFAGTLSFHLPLDGSLNMIAESFVDIFNSCVYPQIQGIKPIVNGGRYLTITFYSKDEELHKIYPSISKKLPEDGIIAMLGDNPDADTFFLTSSSDFKRPVLKFLLDNKKADDYPELLVSKHDYVNGAKEVIGMMYRAERKKTTYRNLPVFSAQGRRFSIADVERWTGKKWEDLRLGSAKANLASAAGITIYLQPAEIKDLKSGDLIIIEQEGGQRTRYKVEETSQQWPWASVMPIDDVNGQRLDIVRATLINNNWALYRQKTEENAVIETSTSITYANALITNNHTAISAMAALVVTNGSNPIREAVDALRSTGLAEKNITIILNPDFTEGDIAEIVRQNTGKYHVVISNASANPDSNADSSTDANKTGAELRKEAAEAVREALESTTSDTGAYAVIFGDYTREDVESLTDRKLYVAVFAPSLEHEFPDKKMEFANKIADALEAKGYELGEPIRSPDPLLGKVSFVKEDELLTYSSSKITDFGIARRDQFCFIKMTMDDKDYIKYLGPVLNEYHDEQYYYGYTAQIGAISKRFQDELAEVSETDKFGLKTMIDEALAKYNVAIPEDAKIALLKLSAQCRLAEKYAEEYGDSTVSATVTDVDYIVFEQLINTDLVDFAEEGPRSSYDEPIKLKLNFMVGSNEASINIINKLDFNITDLLNNIFISEANRSEGVIKDIRCPFNSPLVEGIAILDTSVRNIVIVYEDGIADWKLDELKERMHKLLFMAGAFIKTESIGVNRIYKQDDCPIWISVSEINELIKQQHTLNQDETNILLTLAMHKVYSSKGFEIHLPPIFKKLADLEKIDTGSEAWFKFTRSKVKNKGWQSVRKQITSDWKGSFPLLPGLSRPILDNIDTRKAIYDMQRAWSNMHRLKEEGNKLEALYEGNTAYVKEDVLDCLIKNGYIAKEPEKENFYRLLWHPDSEYMPNLVRIMAAEPVDTAEVTTADAIGKFHFSKNDNHINGNYDIHVRVPHSFIDLNGKRFYLPKKYAGRNGKVFVRNGEIYRVILQSEGPNPQVAIYNIEREGSIVRRYTLKEGDGKQEQIGFVVIYSNGKPVQSFLHSAKTFVVGGLKNITVKDYKIRYFKFSKIKTSRGTSEMLAVRANGIMFSLGVISQNSKYRDDVDNGRFWLEKTPDMFRLLLSRNSNPQDSTTLCEIPIIYKKDGAFIGKYNKTGRLFVYKQRGAGSKWKTFKLNYGREGRGASYLGLQDYWDGLKETVEIDELIPAKDVVVKLKGLQEDMTNVFYLSREWRFNPSRNSPLYPYLAQEGSKQIIFRTYGDNLHQHKKLQIILKNENGIERQYTIYPEDNVFRIRDEQLEKNRVVSSRESVVDDRFGYSIPVSFILDPLTEDEFLKIMEDNNWRVSDVKPALNKYDIYSNFFDFVTRFGFQSVLKRGILGLLEQNEYRAEKVSNILGIDKTLFLYWREKLCIRQEEITQKKKEMTKAKRNLRMKSASQEHIYKQLTEDKFLEIMNDSNWKIPEAMVVLRREYADSSSFFSIVKIFGLTDVLKRELQSLLEQNEYSFSKVATNILTISRYEFRGWIKKINIYDEVSEKRKEFLAKKRGAREKAVLTAKSPLLSAEQTDKGQAVALSTREEEIRLAELALNSDKNASDTLARSLRNMVWRMAKNVSYSTVPNFLDRKDLTDELSGEANRIVAEEISGWYSLAADISLEEYIRPILSKGLKLYSWQQYGSKRKELLSLDKPLSDGGDAGIEQTVGHWGIEDSAISVGRPFDWGQNSDNDYKLPAGATEKEFQAGRRNLEKCAQALQSYLRFADSTTIALLAAAPLKHQEIPSGRLYRIAREVAQSDSGKVHAYPYGAQTDKVIIVIQPGLSEDGIAHILRTMGTRARRELSVRPTIQPISLSTAVTTLTQSNMSPEELLTLPGEEQRETLLYEVMAGLTNFPRTAVIKEAVETAEARMAGQLEAAADALGVNEAETNRNRRLQPRHQELETTGIRDYDRNL